MAPLLLHSSDLPETVRDELRAAFLGEPARRDDHLAAAARLMHHELELPCRDALELVGLPCQSC